MTDKISLYRGQLLLPPDSWFVIWFWGIWSQSLTYRAYRRLGQAVGRALGKAVSLHSCVITGTIGFVPQGDGCPICFHGPAKDVLWQCRKKKASRLMVAESAILRLCNQNFLIICILHWQLPFLYCLPCCRRYWQQAPCPLCNQRMDGTHPYAADSAGRCW